MVKIKQRKPERDKSFGTVALVEDKNGQLQMHCDIVEVDGVSADVIHRIKSAIAGLAYVYEHQAEEIDKLGGAYLNGLETGIQLTQQMHKKKSDEEGGNGSTIGFRAKVN